MSDLIDHLKSARDYCDPHPDLTRAQLLFEMERAKRTLDYVIGQLAPERDRSGQGS